MSSNGSDNRLRWSPHLRGITRRNSWFVLLGDTLRQWFLAIVTPMSSTPKMPRKLTPIWRAMVEVGFIIFLFYSNLLMGKFTHTNDHSKTLFFAIKAILT